MTSREISDGNGMGSRSMDGRGFACSNEELHGPRISADCVGQY